MITGAPELTTHPAPLMLAELACHVLATGVLLYGYLALRAPLGVLTLSPLLKQLLLSLLAAFPLMPRYDALKAKLLLALGASNFLGGGIRDLHDDILALGVGTELLEVASHDLLVRPEPHELRIGVFVGKLVHETVRHIAAAASLRALHVVALVARARDLVGHKVSIALCAKEVPACAITHEL